MCNQRPYLGLWSISGILHLGRRRTRAAAAVAPGGAAPFQSSVDLCNHPGLAHRTLPFCVGPLYEARGEPSGWDQNIEKVLLGLFRAQLVRGEMESRELPNGLLQEILGERDPTQENEEPTSKDVLGDGIYSSGSTNEDQQL